MILFWQAARLFVWMTLVTGIAYPLLITAIAQLVMKDRAEGSLIVHNEKVVGSTLIAQRFSNDRYFWPRPSFGDYNPMASGGSNLGPTSAALKKAVDERKEHLVRAYHLSTPDTIPSELLFASGSGLDPHISVPAAHFQIERIAKARGVEPQAISDLIDQLTEGLFLRFIGRPCVNVLTLNLALDRIFQDTRQPFYDFNDY